MLYMMHLVRLFTPATNLVCCCPPLLLWPKSLWPLPPLPFPAVLLGWNAGPLQLGTFKGQTAGTLAEISSSWLAGACRLSMHAAISGSATICLYCPGNMQPQLTNLCKSAKTDPQPMHQLHHLDNTRRQAVIAKEVFS